MMHTRIKDGRKDQDGYAVSRCKENMNISIISSIIHDGVESMDELIRKYHSMQQQMTLKEQRSTFTVFKRVSWILHNSIDGPC